MLEFSRDQIKWLNNLCLFLIANSLVRLLDSLWLSWSIFHAGKLMKKFLQIPEELMTARGTNFWRLLDGCLTSTRGIFKPPKRCADLRPQGGCIFETPKAPQRGYWLPEDFHSRHLPRAWCLHWEFIIREPQRGRLEEFFLRLLEGLIILRGVLFDWDCGIPSSIPSSMMPHCSPNRRWRDRYLISEISTDDTNHDPIHHHRFRSFMSARCFVILH